MGHRLLRRLLHLHRYGSDAVHHRSPPMLLFLLLRR
ncbi:unnamed protein product [Tetraodon nigroviridis]|uniref:Chromosome undetermined SCAF14610, whole genome shotgun sequence n=1 Tax=Tetraodon nigroviridis TaxID=99883 RepID=Q4SEY8_TETNG|nr:unnamed protein product [Tetraodon nigroviridis]